MTRVLSLLQLIKELMMNRRNFLRGAALASAGLILAEKITAKPYNPFSFPYHAYRQIKIEGKVTAGGKSVPGAVVSDGLTCVQTDSSGIYSLLSSSLRSFVFISLPSGFRIPRTSLGTASFYKPINPAIEVNRIIFELDQIGDDSNHSFLLLADPQTHTMEDMNLFATQTVPDIKSMIAEKDMNLIFGVSCGDIMYDNPELFPEYEKAVKETDAAFFQVFGNHDADTHAKTDEQSTAVFCRHFGPNYYSFNKGEIHYVVLDDIFWYGGGYLGYLTQEQLDWLANDLSFVEKGKTVIVFMHIPVYTKIHERHNQKRVDNSVVITNRQLLYKILEPYKSYCVCGHMHESEFLNDGGTEIHICGAVCGGWWTGPICYDGTPNGYMIYEVSGSSLKWKYKSTGLPLEHQMRIYKDFTFEEKSGLILANIWGYNDRWKLNFYEDGMKTKKLKRINSLDPMSVELHAGDDKPAKHPWVDPGYTDHLFVCEPDPKTDEITVEAVNENGDTFSEKLVLKDFIR